MQDDSNTSINSPSASGVRRASLLPDPQMTCAALERQRDDLIQQLAHELEDAKKCIKALQAEKQEVYELVDDKQFKVSVAQREVKSLEKQLQENEGVWRHERHQLQARADNAEREMADLTGFIAQHESVARGLLVQIETAAADLRQQQAAHLKHAEEMEIQVRLANRRTEVALAAERAAKESAYGWQEHASILAAGHSSQIVALEVPQHHQGKPELNSDSRSNHIYSLQILMMIRCLYSRYFRASVPVHICTCGFSARVLTPCAHPQPRG